MRSNNFILLIFAALMLTAAACERKTETPSLKKEESPSSTPGPQTTNAQVITGRDGAPMVLVPQGVFFMGTNDGKLEEGPRMNVFLEAFYIDRFEISNERFTEFVKKTGYAPQKDFSYPAGMERHPARGISWNDAKAYCEWAGKRLPLEYEWEKAARGPDGRRWPWGEEHKSPKSQIQNLKSKIIESIPEYDDPAGQSPYGCLHMADNVWEWVDDWFGPYVLSNENDPRFGQKFKALRGGWVARAKGIEYSKTTDRMALAPDKREDFVGARCAMDAPIGK